MSGWDTGSSWGSAGSSSGHGASSWGTTSGWGSGAGWADLKASQPATPLVTKSGQLSKAGIANNAAALLSAERANVGAKLAQPSHAGGFEGFVGNALNDMTGALTALPAGIEQIGKQAAFSFGPRGVKESIGQAWNDPRELLGGTIHPLVAGTAYDIGLGHLNAKGAPVLGTDTHFGQVGHRFYQHPLALPMDVLSVLGFGGAKALEGAQAGVRAGRIAEDSRLGRLAADNGRMIPMPDGTLRPLQRGRTIQGRMVQDFLDRKVSPEGPLRRFSAPIKVQGMAEKRANAITNHTYRITHRAVKAFQKLTPNEQFLAHIAGQFGDLSDNPVLTPLEQARQMAEESYRRQPTAQTAHYIEQIQNANPHDLLHPRPEFTQAVHQMRELANSSTEALSGTGRVAAQNEERRLLGVRVASGARPAESDQVFAHRAANSAVADLRRQIKVAEKKVASTRNALTKVSAAPTRAERELQTWSERLAYHSRPLSDRYDEYAFGHAAKGHEVAPIEDFAMRANRHQELARQKVLDLQAKVGAQKGASKFDENGLRVVPEHIQAATDAHATARAELANLREQAAEARKVALRTPAPKARAAETLRGGVDTQTLAEREAEWLSGQREVPGLSPEFGPRFRWPHEGFGPRDIGQGMTKTSRVPLTEVAHGGNERWDSGRKMMAGNYGTHPNVIAYDFGKSLATQHQLMMQHELLDPWAHPLSPADIAGVRTGKLRLYDPAAVRGKNDLLRKLQELPNSHDASNGVRRFVKEEVLPQVRPEHLEYATAEKLGEKGLQVVPKHIANRYENQFMKSHRFMRMVVQRPTDVWRYATLHLRPGWMVNNAVSNAMMSAFGASNHTPDAYLAVLRHHPEIKRFIESHPEFSSIRGALYGTQGRITHMGSMMTDAEARDLTRVEAARTTTAKVGRGAMGAVKAVGNGISRMNMALENIPRTAAFMEDALPRLHAMRDEIQAGNMSLEQALHHIYSGDTAEAKAAAQTAVYHVNRVMGDWQNLSPVERTYIRAFIPFYSWYKVILTVSKNLVVDHPLRMNILLKAAQQTQNSQQANPSWLKGNINSLPGMGPNTMLSTTSWNPFATPAQEAAIAAGLVMPSRTPPTGQGSPWSLTNPFIQSGLTALLNQDMYTGGKNYAPGANQGPTARFLGAMLNEFPEVGYGQHIAGGLHIPGTNYAPIHSSYPSSLYPHQGRLDYLLNFLGLPIKRVDKKEAAKLAAEGK